MITFQNTQAHSNILIFTKYYLLKYTSTQIYIYSVDILIGDIVCLFYDKSVMEFVLWASRGLELNLPQESFVLLDVACRALQSTNTTHEESRNQTN